MGKRKSYKQDKKNSKRRVAEDDAASEDMDDEIDACKIFVSFNDVFNVFLFSDVSIVFFFGIFNIHVQNETMKSNDVCHTFSSQAEGCHSS